MVQRSLNYIVLSPKELRALNNVIILGCDAFKMLDYPSSYIHLIRSIHHVIEFCALGVTLTGSSESLSLFSDELDVLTMFIRKVTELTR